MMRMIPTETPCVRFQFHRSDYTIGDIIGCSCTCNYVHNNELKKIIIRCIYHENGNLADGFYLSVFRDISNVDGVTMKQVQSIPYLINTSSLVGSDDYRRKFLRRVIVYSRPFVEYVLSDENLKALSEKDISIIYNSMLTRERNELMQKVRGD